MSRPLFKTTLEIWTEQDASLTEIEDLAHEASDGDAYCCHLGSEEIAAAEVPAEVAAFFDNEVPA